MGCIVYFGIFLFQLYCSGKAESYESHGLKGDLGVHDPVKLKAGSVYYVLGTGITVKKSEDIVHWKSDSRVFPKGKVLDWWKEDIREHNRHLWAPDIHYRNGKYHLYY